MVQILPGFEAQLGKDIASIFDSVQNVIDPDYHLKEAVRQKVIADPTYAQNLANFAYNNPEIYKKMGLNKIGDVISGMSPDLKTVIDRATKGYVKEEMEKPDSELAKYSAQQKLFGTSQEDFRQNQIQTLQASANLAGTKKRNQALDYNLTQLGRESDRESLAQKAVTDAMNNYAGLEKADLPGLAKRLVSGKYQEGDSALVSQIYAVPGLREQWLLAVQHQKNLEEIEAKKQAIIEERKYTSQDSAVKAWLASDRAGNPTLWRKLMEDPETQQRYTDLMADPSIAETPEDLMLVQMGDSINAKQNGKNAEAIKQTITAMRNVFKDLGYLKGKLGDNFSVDDVKQSVDQLNTIFNLMNDKTGRMYLAKINPRITEHLIAADEESDPIQIIDLSTGQVVDPGEVGVIASGSPSYRAALEAVKKFQSDTTTPPDTTGGEGSDTTKTPPDTTLLKPAARDTTTPPPKKFTRMGPPVDSATRVAIQTAEAKRTANRAKFVADSTKAAADRAAANKKLVEDKAKAAKEKADSVANAARQNATAAKARAEAAKDNRDEATKAYEAMQAKQQKNKTVTASKKEEVEGVDMDTVDQAVRFLGQNILIRSPAGYMVQDTEQQIFRVKSSQTLNRKEKRLVLRRLGIDPDKAGIP